jgi:hypothetical protein
LTSFAFNESLRKGEVHRTALVGFTGDRKFNTRKPLPPSCRIGIGRADLTTQETP